MSNRKAQRAKVYLERQEASKPIEDESPFKPGTKLLKKGWKWVNGEPVKVA